MILYQEGKKPHWDLCSSRESTRKHMFLLFFVNVHHGSHDDVDSSEPFLSISVLLYEYIIFFACYNTVSTSLQPLQTVKKECTEE